MAQIPGENAESTLLGEIAIEIVSPFLHVRNSTVRAAASATSAVGAVTLTESEFQHWAAWLDATSAAAPLLGEKYSLVTITLERGDGSKTDLVVVDLAGSERAGKTGNNGSSLKESAKINASLMNLGLCLEVLRENQKLVGAKRKLRQMVPFRQAKITRVLRQPLTGGGNVVMLCSIYPGANDADEVSLRSPFTAHFPPLCANCSRGTERCCSCQIRRSTLCGTHRAPVRSPRSARCRRSFCRLLAAGGSEGWPSPPHGMCGGGQHPG